MKILTGQLLQYAIVTVVLSAIAIAWYRDAERLNDAEAKLALAEMRIRKLGAEVAAMGKVGTLDVTLVPNSVPSQSVAVITDAPARSLTGEKTGQSAEEAHYLKLRITSSVEMAYGPLFKQLQLGTVQRTQLRDFFVDRQLGSNDIIKSAQEQGLSPRNPEGKAAINELMAHFRDENDKSLRELLTPDQYNEVKEYERLRPQRNTINMLAQRLSSTPDSLQAFQVEQLIPLLSPESGKGRMLITAESGGVSVRITDEAVVKARAVLTAPQLAGLVALQQEQDARLKLAQAAKRTGIGNALSAGRNMDARP